MFETDDDSTVDAGLTRRQLLKAVGGITFLALIPDGRGAFALAPEVAPMAATQPSFTALPYIQPGPNATTLREGQESVVLAWQTTGVMANFTVALRGKNATRDTLSPVRTARTRAEATEEDGRFNYAVTIPNLSLATRYEYTVRMNDKVIAEGYFTTRKPRGQKARFVTFGDNSYGDIADRNIAYQAYKARPEWVMNTGDNVYDGGRDSEYVRYFFPVYNSDTASPNVGAPLLRSVPFFTVLANHDVHGRDTNNAPVANFEKEADALAYYTAMHLPLNGPAPAHPTPVFGPDAPIAVFKNAAGARYPNMANYSYDWADAHFLCLDSNVYVDPTAPELLAWIEKDLKATDATWKFVVWHHPSFNAGHEHYSEQHMRVLSPLLEKYGVDVVLHGHEHNYQRTMPFTFAPSDTSAAKKINTGKRLVPGTFTIDRAYDGVKVTKPKGIIYLTTGAGGRGLYDEEENNDPKKLLHPEDDNVEYIARFISDRHSLTVVDMDAKALDIKQVDQWGNVVDQFRIMK